MSLPSRNFQFDVEKQRLQQIISDYDKYHEGKRMGSKGYRLCVKWSRKPSEEVIFGLKPRHQLHAVPQVVHCTWTPFTWAIVVPPELYGAVVQNVPGMCKSIYLYNWCTLLKQICISINMHLVHLDMVAIMSTMWWLRQVRKMTLSKLQAIVDCSASDYMFSTSGDMGDEPRNWQTLSERSLRLFLEPIHCLLF